MNRGEAWELMYQRRAAAGQDVSGEARCIHEEAPGASVLVAGCGTGRIPRQLAALGHDVAGFDVDPEMVAVARDLAPDLALTRDEVSVANLGRTFDLVVLPGNLLLFLEPARVPAAIRNMARHVAAGGLLVSAFALKPAGVRLEDYEAVAAESGLVPVARWSTWQRAPFDAASEYVVVTHRRP